jgi:hypothetical protein
MWAFQHVPFLSSPRSGITNFFPADTVQNLERDIKLRNHTLNITILNLEQNKVRVPCKYNGAYKKKITKTFTEKKNLKLAYKKEEFHPKQKQWRK